MFLNPQQCVAQCGLAEGMRVADFGAGSGLFARALALRIGYMGQVYAIEVQKDLVKKLEAELAHEKISNIQCIWGDAEKRAGTKIADQSMDAVFIANILFQAADKLGLIDEAKRVLKKGGMAIVIDWSESFDSMGPTKAHVVTEAHAKTLFEKRGFIYTQSISTGDHHYGIIFHV